MEVLDMALQANLPMIVMGSGMVAFSRPDRPSRLVIKSTSVDKLSNYIDGTHPSPSSSL